MSIWAVVQRVFGGNQEWKEYNNKMSAYSMIQREGRTQFATVDPFDIAIFLTEQL